MNQSNYPKVLFIAYHFPPIYNGGAQRPLKFARNLSHYHYQPFVLTTKLFGKTAKPFTFPVLRAGELLGFLKRVKQGRAKDYCEDQNRKAASISGEKKEIRGVKKIIQKIKSFILFPDSQVLWIPLAIWKGFWAIRKHKIKVIFSTYPPVSSHLVGYFLKRLTGKPWVADFRDGWGSDPLQLNPYWGKGQKKRWLRWEERVLRSCDRIVIVTPTLREELRKRYSFLTSQKIILITNGFDRKDFQVSFVKPEKYRKQLLITHTGSFGMSREGITPKPFLIALSSLIKQNPGLKNQLRVKFVGALTGEEITLIEQLGLGKVVERIGQVSFQESIQFQLESDILLVCDKGRSQKREDFLYTPGKIYEYLGAGKPILAVMPEFAPAAEYILESNSGIVVRPENVKGIEQALQNFLTQFKKGALKLNQDQEKVNRFEIQSLTSKLREVFDSLR